MRVSLYARDVGTRTYSFHALPVGAWVRIEGGSRHNLYFKPCEGRLVDLITNYNNASSDLGSWLRFTRQQLRIECTPITPEETRVGFASLPVGAAFALSFGSQYDVYLKTTPNYCRRLSAHLISGAAYIPAGHTFNVLPVTLSIAEEDTQDADSSDE